MNELSTERALEQLELNPSYNSVKTKLESCEDWLSTFNTDSATECFTAVQRLKESLNDRLDEGNTR